MAGAVDDGQAFGLKVGGQIMAVGAVAEPLIWAREGWRLQPALRLVEGPGQPEHPAHAGSSKMPMRKQSWAEAGRLLISRYLALAAPALRLR